MVPCDVLGDLLRQNLVAVERDLIIKLRNRVNQSLNIVEAWIKQQLVGVTDALDHVDGTLPVPLDCLALLVSFSKKLEKEPSVFRLLEASHSVENLCLGVDEPDIRTSHKSHKLVGTVCRLGLQLYDVRLGRLGESLGQSAAGGTTGSSGSSLSTFFQASDSSFEAGNESLKF